MLTLSIALPSIFLETEVSLYLLLMGMLRGKLVSLFQIIISLSQQIFCWGIDLLPYTKQMRLIPSLVQDNKEAYIKGTELLEEVLKDGHRSTSQP